MTTKTSQAQDNGLSCAKQSFVKRKTPIAPIDTHTEAHGEVRGLFAYQTIIDELQSIVLIGVANG